MEKNKSKKLTVVALALFAILIVGATYAYLTEQTVTGKMTDINVTTYTTDVLTFTTGDAINLEADQTTFGMTGGSISGSTYAGALLTANNKTNKAVEHYYLYLNIENNTFTYSVQDNKPELIMTITDKDGNEVKNIRGLTYTEVTDRTNKKISGYDMTTKSGLVTIFNNREIIAEPKAEDKWNITITFVNYEENQNANTGKVLSAKLMIQKEIFNICKNGQNLSSCIVARNAVDDNLYHHDGTLENGINDNSYRYAGGEAHPDLYTCKYEGNDVKNKFNLYSQNLLGTPGDNRHEKGECVNVYKIVQSDGTIMYGDSTVVNGKKNVKWDNTSNKCVTIDNEDVTSNNTLTEETCKGSAYYVFDGQYFKYKLGNVEELGSGVETLVEPADDGVKNFVCFGSDESPCPTDNLYRIIGVFDHKISETKTEQRVKLIKYDYATSDLLGTDGDYRGKATYVDLFYKGSNYKNIAFYMWFGFDNGTWSESNFNKINLNTNFINTIGKKWSDKIAETTWEAGKESWYDIGEVIPSTAYQNEIAYPIKSITYVAKIGLMYVSEYGLAADPSAWTTKLNNYKSERNKNWMYMGAIEWTFPQARFLHSTGDFCDLGTTAGAAVRPSFSLSSSTTYKMGQGTATDPIRITD